MGKTMAFMCLALTMLVFSAGSAFADEITLVDSTRNTIETAALDTTTPRNTDPPANSGDAALYAEIPDKGFPVPMRDGAPIPYKHVALPEEGYEVTSYVYTVSDSSFMESYKEQLRKAGFADQGSVGHIESFWRYDRKSDGLTLLVEMGHEESNFYINMYVNKFSY